MKLGIIGPKDSVTKINATISKIFPEITVKTYIEEKIIDAPRVIDQCQEENDGIIFSGIGVMKSVLNSDKEVIKPYGHIPRNGPSIFKVLWEMKQIGNLPKKISIDVTTDSLLDESLDELGIAFDEVYSQPYSSSLNEEEYLEFHERIFLAGKSEAIITGFGSVYTSLKGKKYPVFRLYPTSIQIKEVVEKLLYKINTQIISDSAIAVQVVKSISCENALYQYETLKRKGTLELKLLEYVQEIQGSLFNFGRDEYIIFSTRGAIKGRENMMNFLEIIKVETRHDFSIFSGIGYGSTSYIAEMSARKALNSSISYGKPSLFVKDGDSLNGPIGERSELFYSTKVSDEKIIKIAEKTGINVAHITKLLSLTLKTGKKEFDSQEIAGYLNITERSARRILNKLLENNLGVLSGKEASKGVGRPKNIIKLKF